MEKRETHSFDEAMREINALEKQIVEGEDRAAQLQHEKERLERLRAQLEDE